MVQWYTDKYILQMDLAVHKKKIQEIQQWMEFALSNVSM